MGNAEIQRAKLLILRDVLSRYTDDDHPLSAAELSDLLFERGVRAERKSIYDDLNALSAYGCDILKTRFPKQGVCLGERKFEFAEIRLLIDAVLTAPFITAKKTQDLVKKLESFLSVYQAEEMALHVAASERIKFENEEIYYTIDAVHAAIHQKKKIKFEYHHRVISNGKAELDAGREFILSPYALLWSNDRYYLVGNYEKYDNIVNYRLDRMRRVEITGEESRPFSEVSSYGDYFDVSDYLRKSVNMYGGEQDSVELRCKNDFLEIVLDRFGSDIVIQADGKKHFVAQLKVYISEGLREWLVQYGDRATVLSPASLREEIREKIAAIRAAYFEQ